MTAKWLTEDAFAQMPLEWTSVLDTLIRLRLPWKTARTQSG